jgi:cytochrome c553
MSDDPSYADQREEYLVKSLDDLVDPLRDDDPAQQIQEALNDYAARGWTLAGIVDQYQTRQGGDEARAFTDAPGGGTAGPYIFLKTRHQA